MPAFIWNVTFFLIQQIKFANLQKYFGLCLDIFRICRFCVMVLWKFVDMVLSVIKPAVKWMCGLCLSQSWLQPVSGWITRCLLWENSIFVLSMRHLRSFYQHASVRSSQATGSSSSATRFNCRQSFRAAKHGESFARKSTAVTKYWLISVLINKTL